MDADYIRPSGLSTVSHCFMLCNYSRLIPFQSTRLTHLNRYPWSFSWKLNSDNLWSLNQRQFFKQLQTQTTTCNQPCTVILIPSPCSQLFLWDPLVRPSNERVDQTLVYRPSECLSLWHYNLPIQLSVNSFGKSLLLFCMFNSAYIHHVLNL